MLHYLYRSTNSGKLCLIGYPALLILIVSIIPEYLSCLQHNVLSNIIGFFNSFGLMQRMKNGWQLDSVLINESKLFLNCVDKVGVLFLVSDPIPISSAKICCRNLLPLIVISWSKSGLKVSRFFSKKPLVS